MRPRSSSPAALLDTPFRVRDALAEGISRDVLRGARFRQPFKGVRVPAHLPDDLETRCRAGALLPDDAAFSHATATILLGLPLALGETRLLGGAADRGRQPPSTAWTDRDPGLSLHVTVPVREPREAGPRLAGMVTHVTKLGPSETRLLPDGLRITTPARTWLDRAATLSVVELVALGDAMLRRDLLTADDLPRAVGEWAGRPGVALSRRAVGLVAQGVDSPMETRLRLLLVLAGLPCPVINQDVVAHGAWIARPDLSYPELKIAIEYDGDHHRVSRRQWQSDIGRRRMLEDEGWIVLVVTADDVLKHGHETVRRVRSLLSQRRSR